MKLNQHTSSVKTNFQSRGADLTIDSEDMGIVLGFLSDGIYSNAIGSIVREYVSNAYDAHIQEGTDDPVQVMVGTDRMGTYFAVKDYGCGMSEEDIDTYFKKYGKSSKRETNEQLGAFGLGSKSFQAYADAVYYTTIQNGIERAFALFKAHPTPRFEPIHEVATDERNGTTVKIYIKSWDTGKFTAECKEQLSYFKNVHFQLGSQELNDFSIVEADTFIVNSTRVNDYDTIHLVLGNVAYPIDFNQINLSWSERRIPIGVKFDIGELNVTISREEIKYTADSVKLIQERIQLAFDELFDLYNSTAGTHFSSYKDYVMNYSGMDKNIINLEGIKVDITAIVSDKVDNKGKQLNPVTIEGYDGIDFRKFASSQIETILTRSIQVTHYINADTGRYGQTPNRLLDELQGHYKYRAKNFILLINFRETNSDSIYYKGIIDQTDHSMTAEKRLINKQLVYGAKKNVYILGKRELHFNRTDSVASAFNLKEYKDRATDKQWEQKKEELLVVLEMMQDELLDGIKKYDDVKLNTKTAQEVKDYFKTTSGRTGSRDTSLLTIWSPYYGRQGITFSSDKIKKDELEERFDSYNVVVVAEKGETTSYPIQQMYRHALDFCKKYKIGMFVASKRTVKYLTENHPDLMVDYDDFVQSEFLKNALLTEIQLRADRMYLEEFRTPKNTDVIQACDTLLGTNYIKDLIDLKGLVSTSCLPHIFSNRVGELEKNLPEITVSENILEKVLELSNIISKLQFLTCLRQYADGSKELAREIIKLKQIEL